MVLVGCGSAPAASSPAPAASVQSTGPQLRVTVTGIPSEFNGKYGIIRMDAGPSSSDPILAWDDGTVNNGSISFNILDWVTDQPYNTTGNYYIIFSIYEDMNAFVAPGVEALWQGVIRSKSIGETNSIDLSEFTKV
jgi:hypothetical protein